MADLKITQMTPAATLDGTEIVPLVQTGANVQTDLTAVINETIQADPPTVRTSLGLGTMATQNANAVAITGGTIPTSVLTGVLGTAHGGTGLSSFTLGDTFYASNTNTITKLAGNTSTTTKFLKQTGTGTVSAAPEWDIIDPTDINTQYGTFYYDDTTFLDGAVTNNQTTITVDSTAAFSSSGAIIIENEIITYSGKTATQFTGCTRGAAGSSNTTHDSGTGVAAAQVASAGVATTVQINQTDLSNGVTLNTSTNEISFAVAGVYNVQYSAQMFNATTTQDLVNIWFDIDGGDVPKSASWGTVPARKNPSTPGSNIMTVNLFFTVTTATKLRLRWLNTDGHGVLASYPEGANYPAAPAVILTVNQVS